MTNTTYRGQRVRATHGDGVCAESGRAEFARQHPAAEQNPADGVCLTRSLRANFVWTLAGNVVYAGCQWGMLMVLAKLGTPEMLGQFVLGLAVTAPVIMLTNLQLRTVLATDARREHRFADYVALRAVSTVIALAVIGGIALSYRGEVCLVILAVAAIKAVESISDIVYGLLQQRERMDLVGRTLMLRGVLAVTAMTVVFYASGNLVAAIAAMAAAWLAVLVFYEARCVRRLCRAESLLASPGRQPGDVVSETSHPRADAQGSPAFRRLGSLLLTGLPLGFVAMLISLSTNTPRYFLELHWGAGELGVFAALSYVGVVGTQIIGALAQSACPRLARYHAAGATGRFWRLLLQLVAVGAAIGAAGVAVAAVAGRPILTLFYSAEYAAELGVFVLLMTGVALDCVAGFLATANTATRGFNRFPIPYLLLTGVVVVCSALWIPQCGLIGAAWTAVVLGAGRCLVPLLLLAFQPPRTA